MACLAVSDRVEASSSHQSRLMPYRLVDYARALRYWGIDVVACGGRHPFKAIREGDSFPFKAQDVAEFKKKLAE